MRVCSHKHPGYSLRVYGLDFTSASGRGKPLVAARCVLVDEGLELEGFETFESYGPLEALLLSPGPWIMGCDFPFSHPASLLREGADHISRAAFQATWPMDWEDYLRGVAGMNREAFRAFMKGCPPYGQSVRERRRVADVAAGAVSPMHVDFPSVGLMFHRAAELLLACPAQVVPQRRNGDCRTLFEVYPGVFAQRFCGCKSYKEGRPGQRQERAARRVAMLAAMREERFREVYGFTVHFHEPEAGRMIEDSKGDYLDAFICAVQAAWAWTRRHENYGLPGPDILDPAVLAFEGWIMDPHCR